MHRYSEEQLALEGADFKSHSQLLGYFNKNYVHSGKFDVSCSKALSKANGLRTDSDYNDFFVASAEDTAELLTATKMFLSAVSAYLSGETQK